MQFLAVVKKSHGRCLMREDFLDLFYDKFLKSSPEVTPYFNNTDLEAQKKLLKHGINCILMYAGGNQAGSLCLHRIGESHSSRKLNIPEHLYDFWKTSLLETIAEVDPKMDADVLRGWMQVIDAGVKFIVREQGSKKTVNF